MEDKNQKTNQTILDIYRGQYVSLVNRRVQLINEIEHINNEIRVIIKKAKAENIDLVRSSVTP